jgi:acetoin utilization protein AcuC
VKWVMDTLIFSHWRFVCAQGSSPKSRASSANSKVLNKNHLCLRQCHSPMPPGVDDEVYLEGFVAIVPPLLQAYQPDVVFTQLGVDSFRDDPLAHGQLTTKGFSRVLQHTKALAPRWIATGGGGYNLTNVARAWTLAWGMMNDVEVPDVLPEAARTLLKDAGYGGKTLRDPALPLHHTQRQHLRAEVHKAVDYLKQHIFPVHRLR